MPSRRSNPANPHSTTNPLFFALPVVALAPSPGEAKGLSEEEAAILNGAWFCAAQIDRSMLWAREFAEQQSILSLEKARKEGGTSRSIARVRQFVSKAKEDNSELQKENSAWVNAIIRMAEMDSERVEAAFQASTHPLSETGQRYAAALIMASHQFRFHDQSARWELPVGVQSSIIKSPEAELLQADTTNMVKRWAFIQSLFSGNPEEHQTFFSRAESKFREIFGLRSSRTSEANGFLRGLYEEFNISWEESDDLSFEDRIKNLIAGVVSASTAALEGMENALDEAADAVAGSATDVIKGFLEDIGLPASFLGLRGTAEREAEAAREAEEEEREAAIEAGDLTHLQAEFQKRFFQRGLAVFTRAKGLGTPEVRRMAAAKFLALLSVLDTQLPGHIPESWFPHGRTKDDLVREAKEMLASAQQYELVEADERQLEADWRLVEETVPLSQEAAKDRFYAKYLKAFHAVERRNRHVRTPSGREQIKWQQHLAALRLQRAIEMLTAHERSKVAEQQRQVASTGGGRGDWKQYIRERESALRNAILDRTKEVRRGGGVLSIEECLEKTRIVMALVQLYEQEFGLEKAHELKIWDFAGTSLISFSITPFDLPYFDYITDDAKVEAEKIWAGCLLGEPQSGAEKRDFDQVDVTWEFIARKRHWSKWNRAIDVKYVENSYDKYRALKAEEGASPEEKRKFAALFLARCNYFEEKYGVLEYLWKELKKEILEEYPNLRTALLEGTPLLAIEDKEREVRYQFAIKAMQRKLRQMERDYLNVGEFAAYDSSALAAVALRCSAQQKGMQTVQEAAGTSSLAKAWLADGRKHVNSAQGRIADAMLERLSHLRESGGGHFAIQQGVAGIAPFNAVEQELVTLPFVFVDEAVGGQPVYVTKEESVSAVFDERRGLLVPLSGAIWEEAVEADVREEREAPYQPRTALEFYITHVLMYGTDEQKSKLSELIRDDDPIPLRYDESVGALLPKEVAGQLTVPRRNSEKFHAFAAAVSAAFVAYNVHLSNVRAVTERVLTPGADLLAFFDQPGFTSCLEFDTTLAQLKSDLAAAQAYYSPSWRDLQPVTQLGISRLSEKIDVAEAQARLDQAAFADRLAEQIREAMFKRDGEGNYLFSLTREQFLRVRAFILAHASEGVKARFIQTTDVTKHFRRELVNHAQNYFTIREGTLQKEFNAEQGRLLVDFCRQYVDTEETGEQQDKAILFFQRMLQEKIEFSEDDPSVEDFREWMNNRKSIDDFSHKENSPLYKMAKYARELCQTERIVAPDWLAMFIETCFKDICPHNVANNQLLRQTLPEESYAEFIAEDERRAQAAVRLLQQFFTNPPNFLETDEVVLFENEPPVYFNKIVAELFWLVHYGPAEFITEALRQVFGTANSFLSQYNGESYQTHRLVTIALSQAYNDERYRRDGELSRIFDEMEDDPLVTVAFKRFQQLRRSANFLPFDDERAIDCVDYQAAPEAKRLSLVRSDHDLLRRALNLESFRTKAQQELVGDIDANTPPSASLIRTVAYFGSNEQRTQIMAKEVVDVMTDPSNEGLRRAVGADFKGMLQIAAEEEVEALRGRFTELLKVEIEKENLTEEKFNALHDLCLELGEEMPACAAMVITKWLERNLQEKDEMEIRAYLKKRTVSYYGRNEIVSPLIQEWFDGYLQAQPADVHKETYFNSLFVVGARFGTLTQKKQLLLKRAQALVEVAKADTEETEEERIQNLSLNISTAANIVVFEGGTLTTEELAENQLRVDAEDPYESAAAFQLMIEVCQDYDQVLEAVKQRIKRLIQNNKSAENVFNELQEIYKTFTMYDKFPTFANDICLFFNDGPESLIQELPGKEALLRELAQLLFEQEGKVFHFDEERSRITEETFLTIDLGTLINAAILELRAKLEQINQAEEGAIEEAIEEAFGQLNNILTEATVSCIGVPQEVVREWDSYFTVLRGWLVQQELQVEAPKFQYLYHLNITYGTDEQRLAALQAKEAEFKTMSGEAIFNCFRDALEQADDKEGMTNKVALRVATLCAERSDLSGDTKLDLMRRMQGYLLDQFVERQALAREAGESTDRSLASFKRLKGEEASLQDETSFSVLNRAILDENVTVVGATVLGNFQEEVTQNKVRALARNRAPSNLPLVVTALGERTPTWSPARQVLAEKIQDKEGLQNQRTSWLMDMLMYPEMFDANQKLSGESKAKHIANLNWLMTVCAHEPFSLDYLGQELGVNNIAQLFPAFQMFYEYRYFLHTGDYPAENLLNLAEKLFPEDSKQLYYKNRNEYQEALKEYERKRREYNHNMTLLTELGDRESKTRPPKKRRFWEKRNIEQEPQAQIEHRQWERERIPSEQRRLEQEMDLIKNQAQEMDSAYGELRRLYRFRKQWSGDEELSVLVAIQKNKVSQKEINILKGWNDQRAAVIEDLAEARRQKKDLSIQKSLQGFLERITAHWQVVQQRLFPIARKAILGEAGKAAAFISRFHQILALLPDQDHNGQPNLAKQYLLNAEKKATQIKAALESAAAFAAANPETLTLNTNLFIEGGCFSAENILYLYFYLDDSKKYQLQTRLQALLQKESVQADLVLSDLTEKAMWFLQPGLKGVSENALLQDMGEQYNSSTSLALIQTWFQQLVQTGDSALEGIELAELQAAIERASVAPDFATVCQAGVDQLLENHVGCRLMEQLVTRDGMTLEQAGRFFAMKKANEISENLLTVLQDDHHWNLIGKPIAAYEKTVEKLIEDMGHCREHADSAHRLEIREAIKNRMEQIAAGLKPIRAGESATTADLEQQNVSAESLQFLSLLYREVYKPRDRVTAAQAVEEDELVNTASRLAMDALRELRFSFNPFRSVIYSNAYSGSSWASPVSMEPGEEYKSAILKRTAMSLHLLKYFGTEAQQQESADRLDYLVHLYLHAGANPTFFDGSYRNENLALQTWFARLRETLDRLKVPQANILKAIQPAEQYGGAVAPSHRPACLIRVAQESPLRALAMQYIAIRDELGAQFNILATGVSFESGEIDRFRVLRSLLTESGIDDLNKFDVEQLPAELKVFYKTRVQNNPEARAIIEISAAMLLTLRQFDSPEVFVGALQNLKSKLEKHRGALLELGSTAHNARFGFNEQWLINWTYRLQYLAEQVGYYQTIEQEREIQEIPPELLPLKVKAEHALRIIEEREGYKFPQSLAVFAGDPARMGEERAAIREEAVRELEAVAKALEQRTAEERERYFADVERRIQFTGEEIAPGLAYSKKLYLKLKEILESIRDGNLSHLDLAVPLETSGLREADTDRLTGLLARESRWFFLDEERQEELNGLIGICEDRLGFTDPAYLALKQTVNAACTIQEAQAGEKTPLVSIIIDSANNQLLARQAHDKIIAQIALFAIPERERTAEIAAEIFSPEIFSATADLGNIPPDSMYRGEEWIGKFQQVINSLGRVTNWVSASRAEEEAHVLLQLPGAEAPVLGVSEEFLAAEFLRNIPAINWANLRDAIANLAPSLLNDFNEQLQQLAKCYVQQCINSINDVLQRGEGPPATALARSIKDILEQNDTLRIIVMFGSAEQKERLARIFKVYTQQTFKALLKERGAVEEVFSAETEKARELESLRYLNRVPLMLSPPLREANDERCLGALNALEQALGFTDLAEGGETYYSELHRFRAEAQVVETQRASIEQAQKELDTLIQKERKAFLKKARAMHAIHATRGAAVEAAIFNEDSISEIREKKEALNARREELRTRERELSAGRQTFLNNAIEYLLLHGDSAHQMHMAELLMSSLGVGRRNALTEHPRYEFLLSQLSDALQGCRLQPSEIERRATELTRQGVVDPEQVHGVVGTSLTLQETQEFVGQVRRIIDVVSLGDAESFDQYFSELEKNLEKLLDKVSPEFNQVKVILERVKTSQEVLEQNRKFILPLTVAKDLFEKMNKFRDEILTKCVAEEADEDRREALTQKLQKEIYPELITLMMVTDHDELTEKLNAIAAKIKENFGRYEAFEQNGGSAFLEIIGNILKKFFYQSHERNDIAQTVNHMFGSEAHLAMLYLQNTLKPTRIRRTHEQAYRPFDPELAALRKELLEKQRALKTQPEVLRQKREELAAVPSEQMDALSSLKRLGAQLAKRRHHFNQIGGGVTLRALRKREAELQAFADQLKRKEDAIETLNEEQEVEKRINELRKQKARDQGITPDEVIISGITRGEIEGNVRREMAQSRTALRQEVFNLQHSREWPRDLNGEMRNVKGRIEALAEMEASIPRLEEKINQLKSIAQLQKDIAALERLPREVDDLHKRYVQLYVAWFRLHRQYFTRAKNIVEEYAEVAEEGKAKGADLKDELVELARDWEGLMNAQLQGALSPRSASITPEEELEASFIAAPGEDEDEEEEEEEEVGRLQRRRLPAELEREEEEEEGLQQRGVLEHEERPLTPLSAERVDEAIEVADAERKPLTDEQQVAVRQLGEEIAAALAAEGWTSPRAVELGDQEPERRRYTDALEKGRLNTYAVTLDGWVRDILQMALAAEEAEGKKIAASSRTERQLERLSEALTNKASYLGGTPVISDEELAARMAGRRPVPPVGGGAGSGGAE